MKDLKKRIAKLKHDFDNKIEKFNYAYQLEKHHIKATKEL